MFFEFYFKITDTYIYEYIKKNILNAEESSGFQMFGSSLCFKNIFNCLRMISSQSHVDKGRAWQN